MTAPTAEDQLAVPDRRLPGAIWIDWGRHLRTHSLTGRLGVPLVQITVAGSRTRRYLRSAHETLQVIREHRPRVVFSTNPSIVLGYLLLLLRPWYRFVLVSDAHYAGVQSITSWPFVQALLNLYNRMADLVIVTNPGHAERLRGIGAHPFICPDPLPETHLPCKPELQLPGKSVFLICSFDVDEPYRAVIEVFRELEGEGFTLYVSGNYPKSEIDPEQHPGVRFLGFVDDATYYAYLREADIVMDLTTLEDCLVCGAYEALAAGKPLILSGSEASRGYFGGACRFTDNESGAIARAVREAYEERDELGSAAQRWSADNQREVGARIARLVDEICQLAD